MNSKIKNQLISVVTISFGTFSLDLLAIFREKAVIKPVEEGCKMNE